MNHTVTNMNTITLMSAEYTAGTSFSTDVIVSSTWT